MSRLAMGALLVLVVAGSVCAQRITIDVKDAALPDAVAAIKQLAGVQIIGDNAANVDTPHVTLKADDAPLTRVMRDLCAQVGWHFTRFGPGYHLMPGIEKDERPRCALDGFDVLLEGLDLTNTLSLGFRGPAQGTHATRQLTLRLVAESDDNEALTVVYGFDPQVAAMTDTGVKLNPLQQGTFGVAPAFGGAINAPIPVQLPPADARRIATLEGDVLTYADMRKIEHEFAIDEVGHRFDDKEISVTFAGYDPPSHNAKFKLMLPETPPEPGRSPQWVRPVGTATLVDQNGAQCVSQGGGYNGSTTEGIVHFEQTFYLQAPEGFEPAKVRYRCVIPRDPTKRLHYKFENVPLPTAPG